MEYPLPLSTVAKGLLQRTRTSPSKYNPQITGKRPEKKHIVGFWLGKVACAALNENGHAQIPRTKMKANDSFLLGVLHSCPVKQRRRRGWSVVIVRLHPHGLLDKRAVVSF